MQLLYILMFRVYEKLYNHQMSNYCQPIDKSFGIHRYKYNLRHSCNQKCKMVSDKG